MANECKHEDCDYGFIDRLIVWIMFIWLLTHTGIWCSIVRNIPWVNKGSCVISQEI